MNRTEHLLTVLAEECIKVAADICKALRFGLDDRSPLPPNGSAANRELIATEFEELRAMVDWLWREQILPDPPDGVYEAKQERVERLMRYAEATGALVEP